MSQLTTIKEMNLTCCRGCDSPAIGVYYLNKGCACDKREIQWLCAQHYIKLEPIDEMECLFIIHEVKGL